MPMRRSTAVWIDKRDRAWRRRCYLRCLDKHLRALDEAASGKPRLAAVYGRLHRSYGVLPWETVPAPALRVDRRKTADLRERFLAARRQLDL